MAALNSALQYQTGNVSGEPFVLTGPVIGMVTHDSARILVEANVACSLECVLTPTEGGQDKKLTLQCEKRRPKAFEFKELQPETFYRIELSLPVPGLVSAGFMTMPENWSLMDVPARVGVVCGNNAIYSRDGVGEATDLWKGVFKMAFKGQIDYMLHIGSNVCVDTGNRDSRWRQAERMLQGVAPSEWDAMRDDIRELFRGAYRETWGLPLVKQALANVPNLMILDEGEICRGFGSDSAHREPDSPDFLLAQCAYDVYNEYQRQLFEDLDGEQPTQAYHFHVLGDIGVMMVDTRAAKTVHRGEGCKHVDKDAALPLLGHRQWRDIEFALSDTGYFAGCRMLLVCCPTPPAWVGDSGVKTACRGGEQSVAGHWFGQEHGPEASYFLAGLFDWRAKKPGLREVAILAGGAGEGFISDVMDVRYANLGDKRVDRMKQIVVGPISDAKSKGQAALLGRAITSAIGTLAPYHQFKHYNHVAGARQFGLLDIFLNYNDRLPELGVQTCFSAQITVANNKKKSQLKPVENTFRQRANFNSTFMGMCDSSKQLPPQYPLDWDEMQNGSAVPAPPYELRSRGVSYGGTHDSYTQSCSGSYSSYRNSEVSFSQRR